MTVNEHRFVMETVPLGVDQFCLECLNPWPDCSCELPTFEQAKQTFEKEPH